MNKKLLISFLVILPLVLLITGFSFDRTKYGTDPESAYLFNGLNIAMFESVGLYEHPGTTAHAFNAVVITVTHFVRFTDKDLQTDVLLNSEYYIEVLRKTYILLNSILLFFLGLVAFRVLKNLCLAILLQLTPFLSTTLVEELATKIAPEQFLFSSSLLLIILVLKYYSTLDKENKRFAIVFGLLGGFGLATKFTFLPMLIIPFIILRGSRNKIIYLFTIIPSFILFTLPAAPAYKIMIKWFVALGTHTGTYGQGSEGVIDPAQYLKSLVDISTTNKMMIFALLSSFIALLIIYGKKWFQKDSETINATAYILAFFLAISGSILMVAKHYHSNHYLFPELSLTGIVFVFLYLWLSGTLKWKSSKVVSFTPQALVIIFLIFALANIPYLSAAYQGYRMSNQSTNETMARIDRDYPGYVKTYYYPGSFNEMAQLRWGNVYAKQFHADALTKLFPKGLFYFWWEKNFQLWETTIPPAEFLKRYGGKILLIGGPNTPEEIRQVEDAGLKLNKLFEGRIQVVYEIDTALSPFFHNVTKPRATLNVLKTDFETFSDDQQWIMADGQKFSNRGSLTTEKPRSGKYSFAMPVKDSYAMEYVLKNIRPGNEYEVFIWRFGGDDESSMVVSAQNSDLFYVKSRGTIEKDAGGWSKIVISVKIPEGFKENMLKVYLWNHSNKPAWFDDFEIDQYK